MAENELIRLWRGEPARFIEAARDGTIVVTVGRERREVRREEWDALPAYNGETPSEFDKPDTAAFEPSFRSAAQIEVAARSILALILKGGYKAGEGPIAIRLQTDFVDESGSSADYIAGLEFARKSSWIAGGETSVLLTHAGFEEAKRRT